MTKRMHLYVQKDIYSYKSWKLAFFPNICRAQSSHHLFWTKYKSIIRKDMCLLWKLHNCSYQNSSNITDQSINNTCTCITLRCPVFVKVYSIKTQVCLVTRTQGHWYCTYYSQFCSIENILTEFLVVPGITFNTLTTHTNKRHLGNGTYFKVKGQFHTSPIIHHSTA